MQEVRMGPDPDATEPVLRNMQELTNSSLPTHIVLRLAWNISWAYTSRDSFGRT